MRIPRLMVVLLLGFISCSMLAAVPDTTYVPTVIEQLASRDSAERERAVRILAALRVKDAVPRLIPLLQDNNPRVRAEAAIALGKLADVKSEPALIAALKDPDATVQMAAVTALGMTRSEKASAALVEISANGYAGMRLHAVQALAGFHDDNVLVALAARLHDEKGDIRTAAATSLGINGDLSVATTLLEAVKDNDPRVRVAAIQSLARLHADEGVSSLLTALTDTDPIVRAQAATALGEMGDQHAVTPLISALDDGERPVKIAAITALGQLKDAAAIDRLIGIYTEDDYELKRPISTALLRIGEPAILRVLDMAQNDPQVEQRCKAILLLGDLQDPRGINILLAALENDGLPKLRALNVLYNTVRHWSDGWFLRQSLTPPAPPIAFWRPNRPVRSWAYTPAVGNKLLEESTKSHDLGYLLIAAKFSYPGMVDQLLQSMDNADEKTNPFRWNVLIEMQSSKALSQTIELLKLVDHTDKNNWEGDVRGLFYSAVGSMRDVRDITPLTDLLKNEDPLVRKTTAALLGWIGDPRAVDPLVAMMRTDQVPEVREYAALALGLIKDTTAVPALTEALQDNVEWARSAAAWALGEIGDRAALESLQNAIREGDPRFNVRITRALWQIRYTKGVDLFLQLLHDTDSMTRSIAANNVGEILNPRIADGLLTIRENGDDLGYALQSLIDHPNKYAVGSLIDMISRDDGLDDSGLRGMAARALGVTGDQQAVAPLLAMMENEEEASARVSAAFALAQLGDARAVPVLLAAMEDQGSDNRVMATMGLAYHKDAPVTTALAARLTDHDALVRLVAARSLALQGDARGVDALIAALSSGQEEILQTFTMRFLGEVKAMKAVPALLDIARTGVLEDRVSAFATLGQIGAPSALQPMLDIMATESNPRVQLGFASALGGIHDAQAVKPLTALLASPYSETRLAAAASLGSCGMREGIPQLIDALGDSASRVRRTAAAALATLTGQEFGEDQDAWREWNAR